jgi:transposase
MSPTDPAAGLPPRAAEHLPDDPAMLQRMVLELLTSLHECQRDNEALRHRLDLLLRRLYGPRGERFDPSQALLFPELAPGQGPAAAPAEAAGPKPQRRCRAHGRRRLPAHLPREPRHHELAEAERVCPNCGRVRVDSGTDRSEQLDYRPASLFVVEHFVHKYACPCCSRAAHAQGQQGQPTEEPEPMPLPPPDPPSAPTAGAAEPRAPHPESRTPEPHPQAAQPLPPPEPAVVAAPRPAQPIAQGLPGPGLLAHLIVSKYTDHLPLHRRQRVYERQGYLLHRSTLCDWLGACADLLRPLYDLMVGVVLQSRALHTDDTAVK